MGDIRTFLQNLTAGIGTASNTPAGTHAASVIEDSQQRQRDAQAQNLTMLQDAAKKQQLIAAHFTDPTTGKAYPQYQPQYDEAMNRFSGLAGQIYESQHPDPGSMSFEHRMGIRALSKMHLTNDLNSRIKKWKDMEGTFKDNLAASDSPEASNKIPELGALTPEEQHRANLIKGGIEPKAVVPKDAPENWQTLDVKFADGTTQTVQRNTKDGRITDLAGNDIPSERLSGASAVPKPTSVHPPSPKAGVSGGKNVFAVLTDKGWIDAGSKEPLKDFRPAPTFAETGLWGVDPVQNSDGSIGSAMVNRRTGQTKQITGVGGTPIAPSLMAQVNKSIEPALEAETRLNVMEQNAKDALAGNQQAMLSLVANHIGMTLGAQKGARINQAVWNEAIESSPWLQNVGKKFGSDGYLQGVTLSPQQIKQILELGRQRRDEQWKQAKQAGVTYGVNVPIPERDSSVEGPSGQIHQKLLKTKQQGGEKKLTAKDLEDILP